MSVKIKPYTKDYKKVLENINKYPERIKQQHSIVLTESMNAEYDIRPIHKSIKENAEFHREEMNGCIGVFKKRKVLLYENSLFNQKTVKTEPVLIYTFEKYPILAEQNFVIDIHYDNQVIADAIMFKVPLDINNLDDILNDLEEIWTSNGYFQSMNTNDEDENCKCVQYEPYQPDGKFIKLPDVLYHVTTVKNAEIIKTEGLKPMTNDVFHYSPRIYFVSQVDIYVKRHLLRRHRKDLLQSKTGKLPQYAIIEINVPDNVQFYKDTHMISDSETQSYFTFDAIGIEYIKNIKIEDLYIA